MIIILYFARFWERGVERVRGRGGEVFAHHPGQRGLQRGGSGAQNSMILTRKSPKSTRNSPVLTQIGLHLARKSPGSARVWSGGMWGGVFVRGRCWGMSCWSEEKFWAVEFLLHAADPVLLGKIFQVPTPLPPPAPMLFERGAALAREGETIRYISFQRGRAPFVSPTGESTPPHPLLRGGASPPSHPPLQEESRSFLAGWEISLA